MKTGTLLALHRDLLGGLLFFGQVVRRHNTPGGRVNKIGVGWAADRPWSN